MQPDEPILTDTYCRGACLRGLDLHYAQLDSANLSRAQILSPYCRDDRVASEVLRR